MSPRSLRFPGFRLRLSSLTTCQGGTNTNQTHNSDSATESRGVDVLWDLSKTDGASCGGLPLNSIDHNIQFIISHELEKSVDGHSKQILMQEDQALKELYEKRGIKKWAEISRILHKQFKIQNRSGKQCRERYHNHLDSAIKHEKWSAEEEAQLMALQEQVGNRWAEISRSILGRSENCVKNQFYSILRRGLRKINNIIRSRLKRYKQLQINILYKIVQSAQNTETESVQSNSLSLKKEIAYYGMTNEDNQAYDLKRVRDVIQKIKGFGKIGSTKKKPSPIKKEEKQRYSEEIQSSEYRDNFPVSENDKEMKELKPRRNSLYSFHLQKEDQKNEQEIGSFKDLCPSPALMPQTSLLLRKTSLSNMSHEGMSPRYQVTSPKIFDIFAPQGQMQHTQNSFKSPSTGLICESPYFDQLRPSLYSTWYNLYPH